MLAALRSSFLPAVIGGVVVALAFSLLDVNGGERGTTVVQQAPIAQAGGAASSSGEGRALTARDIYKRDAPGVVFVRAQVVRASASPFDLFQDEPRGESTGSGFVIDEEGHILTNAHVIESASSVTVTVEDRARSAQVVGKDPSTDLALVKIDPDGLDLDPLELGDSSSVEVGDPTIAIGNPFGLDRTLTTGVVSALQRQITAPDDFTIENVIQTDAAINPGNSGGPLLDGAGRVIGINSQIATGGGGGGNVGIAFAVPINTAKDVVPELKETGKVERGYLGISGVAIDGSLAALNLESERGVLVQEITPGGPAAKAGIRGGDTPASLNGSPMALGGDVISRIDGREVGSMADIVEVVNRHKPGDAVEVDLVRAGESRSVEVELGARPTDALPG
jgi:S1-C subfamily serine protease